jgi:antitoxin CptB
VKVELTSERDLKRLQWRCRRGLLELDLVLMAFLQRDYDSLTPEEQCDFSELLELPDNVLLDFLHLKAEPDDEKLKQIIKKIL